MKKYLVLVTVTVNGVRKEKARLDTTSQDELWKFLREQIPSGAIRRTDNPSVWRYQAWNMTAQITESEEPTEKDLGWLKVRFTYNLPDSKEDFYYYTERKRQSFDGGDLLRIIAEVTGEFEWQHPTAFNYRISSLAEFAQLIETA